MKKSSSYENSVGCRFDYFCKKVLKGERIDYERQLYTIDEYDMENDCFQVLGYDITVKDDLIAEALQALTEKKRNVILLSYFMDMNDTEIAKEMNLVCSTIYEHRKKALDLLKKAMEENTDGKNE